MQCHSGRVDRVLNRIEGVAGGMTPVLMAGLFVVASLLIVWRLEVATGRGVKGTVLGTLVMPYFSGLGNLIFVGLALRDGTPGGEVFRNAIVNNLTNLTLILGGVSLVAGLSLRSESKNRGARRESRLNRLSLALSLLAMVFFTFATYGLAMDGGLDRGDGMVLVGLFLFWQAFHVYEVLRDVATGGDRWSPWLVLDFGLILVGSFLTLVSLEWIVGWIMARDSGWIRAENLGLLTGLLMVLPNASLAIYYGLRERGEIAYASQVGDAHICIPFAIGLYALFQDLVLPDDAGRTLQVLALIAGMHLVSLMIFQSLPRRIAAVMVVIYGALWGLQWL